MLREAIVTKYPINDNSMHTEKKIKFLKQKLHKNIYIFYLNAISSRGLGRVNYLN